MVNVVPAGIIFSLPSFPIKGLGVPGAKALFGVTGLFLAAIAAMMVRKGIVQFF